MYGIKTVGRDKTTENMKPTYHIADKPIWWSDRGSKEAFKWILSAGEYKFNKKVYEDDEKILVYYLNMPMAFDIEDTSFYDADYQKVSVMYVWQFGINGYVFMGRTWDEFIDLINTIKAKLFDDLEDGISCRCIIYVHFLDHEFQFIRKHFKWDSVFARKSRSPIYALTEGVEFRDSYILTGKSLAKVADDLRESDLKKMIGDLDYTQMRGTETPLTDKEIGYCMADVQILNEMTREKIEDEHGNISRIPLTNTGYVRRYTRKKCMPTSDKDRDINGKYFNMIHDLNINDLDEYYMLEKAFQGGFTHANALYVGETITDEMGSVDFTSSYPAQMLANKYPMSTGQRVKIHSQKELETYFVNNCVIFTVMFTNIRTRDSVYDGIISRSKCEDVVGCTLNNGRVMKAERLTTTMTEVDFDSVKRFYVWDKFYLGAVYIYKKDYLPKPIIETVLDLYQAKTTLKGVAGAEVEYMLKKSMLNSTYGMMVQNPMSPDIPFDLANGEWLDYDPDEIIGYGDTTEDKMREDLEKYNSNKRRFLFYPWGVYVTAYARKALYSGILSFGKDYVYSDTDSIKCLHLDKHMTYINNYDKWIVARIDETLKHYDLDPDLSRPKNKKGEIKQIGVWDIETAGGHPYTRFKTLGAKRYIYEQDGELHITIAGVSKKMGADFLSKSGDPFKLFEEGMEIDKENSGKLTHTYIDNERSGFMTDYLGHVMQYDELSSVHLEQSPYCMSVVQEFKDFCHGVQSEVSNR